MTEPAPTLHTDAAVRERYGAAARAREQALCCPVDYEARYLEVIPKAVLERDYGCGDPSRYVREGDTVLDLGSGGGKICFIASQIAGPQGSVIGVDMTDDMLALARESAPRVAEALGYENTRFVRGRIQDLALDFDRLAAWAVLHPVSDARGLQALEEEAARLRADETLIPDASVDLVVSNCVLNLVREEDRERLVSEIFRVLRVGGRIAISDIVSDEQVPEALKRDPELWSGCVSGAFQERRLLRALEEAGFHGIAVDKWESQPFAVVDGIEFRSVTVTAHKGKQGPCLEANQAVLYRGPWRRVEDDDGHVFERGVRTAVCAKTYALLEREPYAGAFVPIPPRQPVAEAERRTFDCARSAPRHPRESKGQAYRETREPGAGSCC
jgi:ubiquinone/menaquinone biosynthesis C-methylase UbiE